MEEKFKNILTQRFHDYFYQKVKDKSLEADKFFEDFGVSGVNKPQFFSGMRSGHRGITPDQVLIAWEKYGVRPDYLFGIVNQPESLVAEPPPSYSKKLKKDIDKIRKALDELERKIENK